MLSACTSITWSASGPRGPCPSTAWPRPEMARLLYCRCAYAQVVPREVKDGVLEALATAGTSFDAVPDLCEMSARRDPRLAELAASGELRIAACYPRAVRWL